MSEGDPVLAKTILRHAPQGAAGLFFLVYITGYLVDYHYYSSLGISESGAEILKFKYIQTGLDFFILCAIVVGFVFFLICGARRMNSASGPFGPRFMSANPFTTTMTIFFILSLYAVTILTPPRYFSDAERLWAIFILVSGVVVGYILAIEGFERYYKLASEYERAKQPPSSTEATQGLETKLKELRSKHERNRTIVAIVIFFFILGMDIIIFDGMHDTFRLLFNYHAAFLFLFLVTIGIYLFRVFVRAESIPAGFASVAYCSVNGLAIIVIYYLAVLTYAYTVFPFIPSEKGGADFTLAPLTSVTFRPSDSAQPQIDDAIAIFSNTSFIYFAKPKKGNDACQWRTRSAHPSIFVVNRAEIQQMVVRPVNLNNCLSDRSGR